MKKLAIFLLLAGLFSFRIPFSGVDAAPAPSTPERCSRGGMLAGEVRCSRMPVSAPERCSRGFVTATERCSRPAVPVLAPDQQISSISVAPRCSRDR